MRAVDEKQEINLLWPNPWSGVRPVKDVYCWNVRLWLWLECNYLQGIIPFLCLHGHTVHSAL